MRVRESRSADLQIYRETETETETETERERERDRERERHGDLEAARGRDGDGRATDEENERTLRGWNPASERGREVCDGRGDGRG